MLSPAELHRHEGRYYTGRKLGVKIIRVSPEIIGCGRGGAEPNRKDFFPLWSILSRD